MDSYLNDIFSLPGIQGNKVWDKKKILKLIEKCGIDLLVHATANAVNAESETAVFCCNCSTTLKSKRCPKLSIANGMQVDEIPEELMKATDLEQQLFARMLVFTKIVRLPAPAAPQYWMKGVKGKMINVPLEESDISKSLTALPRCVDDASIVALQLKKKQELKSAYAESFIRPTVCIKAVEKLIELQNPHYANIEIDEKFMEKGKRHQSENDETKDDKDDENDDKSDMDEMENVEILNSVKEHQANHEENTCLIREDLESIIVENQTKETIHKKKGKGIISIAPGENKVAIQIMFFHYQFGALVYFLTISDS